MPNPDEKDIVSDLLRRIQLDLHDCARVALTSEHMETIELLKEAKAEIERLSRERGTVPEGCPYERAAKVADEMHGTVPLSRENVCDTIAQAIRSLAVKEGEV